MESPRAWGHPGASSHPCSVEWPSGRCFFPPLLSFPAPAGVGDAPSQSAAAAGDSPLRGKNSQRTTAPFSRQENTSGSLPDPQQDLQLLCCLQHFPAPLPFQGASGTLGKASFPFSLPAAPGAPGNTGLHPLPFLRCWFWSPPPGTFPRMWRPQQ